MSNASDRHVTSQSGIKPEPAVYPAPPKPPPGGAPWVADRPVPWNDGVRKPPSPPRYPKQPPTTDQVQIYATNQLICDRRRLNLGEVHYGDLAVLPDGRLRCRRLVKMGDGSLVFGYVPFDPDRDIEEPLPPVPDWAARLEGRINQAGGPFAFQVLEPLPPGENDRLCDQFPELASQLGVARTPTPPVLFNLGQTRYRRQIWPRVAVSLEPAFWRGLALLEHASGRWGYDGSFADVGELSEAMVWTAEELPVATQNALAIRAGVGTVRSRHPLPPEAEAAMREDSEWKYQRPVVEILSLLGRQTLMVVAPLQD